MADIFSKEQRSRIMAAVKSKDTKPEELVRKYLFANGLRYRKNVKTLPGCPDIVLPKYDTVIFINGCFWHQHPGCKAATTPQSNRDFWIKKLQRNVQRDKEQFEELVKLGWHVIIIWECEISTIKKRDQRLPKLVEEILG